MADELAGAALQRLREQGAPRQDPVQFRFMEALARRAATQQGEARRALDARLTQLLQQYERRHPPGAACGVPPAAAAASPRRRPLAELVGALAKPASPGLATGRPADLPALAYFRQTWSRLSADRQLSQSLGKGAENAGPLNSHRLVLQSLQAMRDISPAYVRRFMSQMEALLWLDSSEVGARTAGSPAVTRPGARAAGTAAPRPKKAR